jgi:hypothetical protein
MTSATKKRDIFRFSGEKPTALNLEHVTTIVIEGKRITFTFYNSVIFIDIVDEEAAKVIFEQILNEWAGNVVE